MGRRRCKAILFDGKGGRHRCGNRSRLGCPVPNGAVHVANRGGINIAKALFIKGDRCRLSEDVLMIKVGQHTFTDARPPVLRWADLSSGAGEGAGGGVSLAEAVLEVLRGGIGGGVGLLAAFPPNLLLVTRNAAAAAATRPAMGV
jgi:hypothetical protein